MTGLPSDADVLARLLGYAGPRRTYYHVRCPAHDDRTPSLALWNVPGRDTAATALRMRCFAGCDSRDVRRAILASHGGALPCLPAASPPRFQPAIADFRIVTPVPNHALRRLDRIRHPQWGPQIGQWLYRDAAGHLLGAVLRFATSAPDGVPGKLTPFYAWGQDLITGRFRWRQRALPKPRPLYNLHLLAQHPDRPVLIAEGEKAADAAGRLLPGWVPTTSPGGSKAAAAADWRPLAGRTVVFWPDHDAPGEAYALTVSTILAGLGTRNQHRIHWILGPRPSGHDAGDALADGLTPDLLAAAYRDRGLPPSIPLHLSRDASP